MAPADAVSQSTVGRTIQPVEDKLIQCRQLRRPRKREWLENQTNIQRVRVDASEQPMERTDKNSLDTTAARKKQTPPAQIIINQHR